MSDQNEQTAGAEKMDTSPTPVSLHDEVLTRLRDCVVEGQFAPGAKVPERELCLRFGVSRTPLREALKVLAAEGLVDLLPNRGARVRQLSAEDVRNAFEVLAGLEALAGRLACERITDDRIAEIERLHYAMYTSYMQRDMHEYFLLNQKIHEHIVEATGNPVLHTNYNTLNARIRPSRFTANFNRRRDRWAQAMREHEAILDALKRRAGPELSEIVYAHLQHKCDAVLDQMVGRESAA